MGMNRRIFWIFAFTAAVMVGSASAVEMSTAAGRFRSTAEDTNNGQLGTTVTIKSNSLVQAFNGQDGGYTVNAGHTLQGDADSKLTVLGYSNFTGTLTIENGGTLDTEGKMSVTSGGYLDKRVYR
ncbi:MAG: hypothetical protein LUE17_08880 [Planctomycetaceae bacterium]|nr:hypothetical protein [Planctomycetaceae bacterium]